MKTTFHANYPMGQISSRRNTSITLRS